MKIYHCTTPKKMERYKNTGCILSPVRGWKYLRSAENWCKKTGRTIILEMEIGTAYPPPDHKPLFHSYWADENVKEYQIVRRKEDESN